MLPGSHARCGLSAFILLSAGMSFGLLIAVFMFPSMPFPQHRNSITIQERKADSETDAEFSQSSSSLPESSTNMGEN